MRKSIKILLSIIIIFNFNTLNLTGQESKRIIINSLSINNTLNVDYKISFIKKDSIITLNDKDKYVSFLLYPESKLLIKSLNNDTLYLWDIYAYIEHDEGYNMRVTLINNTDSCSIFFYTEYSSGQIVEVVAKKKESPIYNFDIFNKVEIYTAKNSVDYTNLNYKYMFNK